MIGNLTRDPELKSFQGNQFCKFTIAMNHRSSKDNSETCFIDVTAWGKQAEFVIKYFKKGNPILVEGRLKLETWEKDGKQQSKHVIYAEKISFTGSYAKETIDEPMINESKRIFPSDIKARVSAQYEIKNGQQEIGVNNLDESELPF